MKFIITILLLTIGAFAQNTTYKDGTDCECDSIVTLYREVGSTLMQTAYKNGEEYYIKIYYENGLVEHEFTVKDGDMKFWYESGMLKSSYHYVKGLFNGEAVMYYESGAVRVKSFFVNHLENGIKNWYFESGKLAGTATYKNGALVGYKKCTDGRFGNENLDCLK